MRFYEVLKFAVLAPCKLSDVGSNSVPKNLWGIVTITPPVDDVLNELGCIIMLVNVFVTVMVFPPEIQSPYTD